VVQVFHQSVAGPAKLNETTTGIDGKYRITFTKSQFLAAEGGRAPAAGSSGLQALVVSTGQNVKVGPNLWGGVPRGSGGFLVKSDISFNAGIATEIDLALPAGAGVSAAGSEFERVSLAVIPTLNGLSLENLTDDQTKFLSKATGLALAPIQTLAQAAKLAKEIEPAPADKAMPPTSSCAPSDDLLIPLYGLLRTRAVQSLSDIMDLGPDVWRPSLQTALNRAILPASLSGSLDTWVAKLADLRLSRALQPATTSASTPSLGDLLDALPASATIDDASKRSAVARLWTAGGAKNDAFWTKLAARGISDVQAAALKTTMALNDLAGGKIALVKALQARTPTTPDGTLAHLAALDQNQWFAISAEAASKTDSLARIGATASDMQLQIEHQYPSASFKAGLDNGSLKLDRYPTKDVSGFLARFPAFDLAATDIEPFLLDQKLIGNTSLKSALLGAQRWLRAGATQSEAAFLWNAGLEAPHKLVARGTDAVISALSGAIPQQRLAELSDRAHQLVGDLLAMASVVAGRFNPNVAGLGGMPTSPDALKRFPSLAQLFGDQSYCSCRHCNSVLGPAAYLVDLLHILSQSGVEGELKARRPDILGLELSCENTNTEMPYVDLVLEVLESAVCFPEVILLTSAEMAQLDAGTAPQTLLIELKATVERLDGTVTVDFDPAPTTSGAPRGLTLANGTRRWIAERQHKSMNVSGIFPTGFAGATVPAPDASIDAIVQALQQGRVDTALQTLVCPEPRLPVAGTPTVTALSDGTWTVAFNREVYITFDVSSSPNQMQFLASDLSLIESWPIPADWLTSLFENALNQGTVPLPIAGLLPPLVYKASHAGSTFTERWVITTIQTVTVTYAPDSLTLTGMAYVASKADTDLTVFPANRNPKAYALLADATASVFPWTLPFDPFIEEARACLAALGLPRGVLLRTLRPKLIRMTLEDACESLATSLQQLQIAAEAEPDDTRGALLWGLNVSGNALIDPSGDSDAAAIPSDWVGALSRLSVLIDRSGVPVTTLSAALLYTLYLQAVGTAPSLSPQFECRPSQVTVNGLSSRHLKRLHRLLRLRLITGWTIRDLDTALWAVSDGGQSDVGQVQIVGLANIQELSRRFSLPIRQVAAWVGPMETHAYTDVEAAGSPVQPSLYDEVFLAARPGRSSDPDFILNSAATELNYLTPGTTPKKLTDKLQQLGAALSIDPTGLAALITSQAPLLQDELTLAMLTRLFSYVSQAKALGVSVADWAFAFSQMYEPTGSGSPPTADHRSARVLHFADVLHEVKASGFSFDELAQCLDQRSTDLQADAARDSDHLQWLTQVQNSLRAVQDAADIAVTEAALRSAFTAAGWSVASIDRILGDTAGPPLGLNTTRLVVTFDADTPPPIVPASLPFALASEPSGQFNLSLEIDTFTTLTDTETPFANLVQAVSALGPLTDTSKPAAILRTQWRNQSAAISVLSKWLQSIEQQTFSRILDFSIPAPQGLATGLVVPGSLVGVIDTSTGGSLVVHGFISADQAAALKAAATGASNASAFGQAVDSLVGPPLELTGAGSRLQYDPQGASLMLLGYLDASEKTDLAGLSARQEFAAAVQALSTAADAFTERRSGQQLMSAAEVQSLFSQQLSPEDRYVRVYAAMVRPLRREIAGRLASARAGLDPRLFSALDSQAELANPARDVLAPVCSAEFVNSVISTDHPPTDALSAAVIIDRVGLVARRLKVAVPEATWFDPTKGFLGLAACSLTALSDDAASPAERFRAWRRMIALFTERSLTPQQSAGVEQIRLAAGNSLGAALDIIAALFMLPSGSTDALKLDGEIAHASDLLDPLKLRKVLRAARTIRRSSSTADLLLGVCAAAPTDADSVAARGALYAKYGVEIGAAGLREAINRLREKERVALVEYLIHRKGLTDSADLHAFYLLDVNMGPEMLTSRLKQAIGSTQLFFQRWLMNLEASSLPRPSADIAQQWEWARNYRVWEANRKIFLYPEDWLEPSLRDDKSDLFRKFETGLLQGEPSTDTALQLLQDYLVGLQQLSRLSIRAMYTEDTDSSGEALVHLVARTIDSPSQFYYRRWRIKPFSPTVSRWWTPWEPLSSVSDSEHVVCFVRDGRPSVAWLQIHRDDSLVPSTQATNGASNPAGPGDWEIELQWSRRGNDGWSAPQKWKAPNWPVEVNKRAAESFALRLEDNNGSPRLCLYGAQDVGDSAVFIAPFQLGESSSMGEPPLDANANFTRTTVKIQVTGTYDSGGDDGVLYVALDEAKVEIWGDWYVKEQVLSGDVDAFTTLGEPPSVIWPTADSPAVLTVSKGTAQIDLLIPVANYQVVDKWAYFVVRVTVIGLEPQTSPQISFDPTQNNQIQLGVQFPISSDDPRLSPDRPVRLIQFAAVTWGNSLGLTGGGPGDGTELWRPNWTNHRSSGYYMAPDTHIPWPPIPQSFDPGNEGWSPTFPFNWAGLDLTKPLVSWFVAGSAGFNRGDIDWPFYLEADGSGAIFAPTAKGWLMMPAQELAWPAALAAADVSSATSLSLGSEHLVEEFVRLQTAIQPASGVACRQSTDTEFELPMFNSGYDWEIYFHIPVTVAKALATHQRFAEALRWLHLIFDPTASLPTQQRHLLPLFGAPLPPYWKFRPFAEAGQGINIDTLLANYSHHTLDSTDVELLNAQITYWKREPFEPYGIARMRIRAFQWRTLFDYLDVVIGWADQLFKQDTIESINQATQLYLLAWELLGRRPTAMPEQPPPGGPPTFARYESRWDDFANAWVSLGDVLPGEHYPPFAVVQGT
jgi:hypothetical protein